MINIEEIIKYMIKNNATIREAAKTFGIPKSTLFDRIKKKIKVCDAKTENDLEEMFYQHNRNKQKTGGKAFKSKYQGKKRIDIIKKKS